MRNLYILFFILFSTSFTKAQTITPDWLFAIGDSIQSIAVSNISDFEAPTSGIDQEWDYSTILTEIDTFTFNFVDPSTLSTVSQFRNADVALEIPGAQEVFYSTGGDTLKILGISLLGGPYGPVQIKYDTGNEEIIGFDQMAFGDTVLQTITGDLLVYGDPVQAFEIGQELSFDGLGSIQLPNITLDNCVKFTNTVTQNGEETALVSTIYFNSFSNAILTYQTQIDPYGGPDIVAITQGVTDNLSTSTIAADVLQAKIFSDKLKNIYIDMDESIDASIQIISLDGRPVENHQMHLSTGRNQLTLNNNYSAGIYVVFLVDKNTGKFKSHKMYIER